MENRRRFERILLPEDSKVYAKSAAGKRLGPVTVLGRGGCMIDMREPHPVGQEHSFIICDESEQIECSVKGVIRNQMPGGLGFEFLDLGADQAVEIGVIIGKYYASQPH